ncbi:MAG: GxxExxY protein [Desulfobacterales bacterium]|nr:GxxExxY protein [Desulfobacterales bacterium]
MNLKYEEFTDKILQVFFAVYNELGFGFLESVYENAMAIALNEAGLTVEQQGPIPVWFRGKKIGDFRCDLLLERIVILELKSARNIGPEHMLKH